MSDDEIRPITLCYVEYLRTDLDTRRRHREGPQLEPFSLLQIFDNRQRLATRRVVVEDVGDLFALEASAEFVLGELDGSRALRPIGRGDWKQVGVTGAICRSGDPEAGRSRRDLVLLQTLVECHCHRCPVERHQHGTLLLMPLIRFNRLRDLVFVVDLLSLYLVALDSA